MLIGDNTDLEIMIFGDNANCTTKLIYISAIYFTFVI